MGGPVGADVVGKVVGLSVAMLLIRMERQNCVLDVTPSNVMTTALAAHMKTLQTVQSFL